ncbi:MAG: type II secretion system protein N [Candidatus Competibacteraceae bacterium]
MKRFLGYGLLGLAAFLFFMLMEAPAGIVMGLLGQRLSGLNVQSVRGTALDGAAHGVRWRTLDLEQVAWRWRPFALLMARLEYGLTVTAPEITLTGRTGISLDRQVQFHDLTGHLPLATLGVLARQPLLPAQGMVEFDSLQLRLNDAGRPLVAQGRVRLLKVRANLGQPLELGDFEIQLHNADASGIQGLCKDTGGPLLLTGTLTLAPDGRYRFNGQFAVRDAANQTLRQALQPLGPPNNDGQWPFNFSGTLPF